MGFNLRPEPREVVSGARKEILSIYCLNVIYSLQLWLFVQVYCYENRRTINEKISEGFVRHKLFQSNANGYIRLAE